MNISFKLIGIFLMSLLAFFGSYLLKITLIKIIPDGSNLSALFRTMPNIVLEAKFWLAGLLYCGAMTVYLFLLQGDQLSKIFPMAVGVNILLTALGAILFLGDKMDFSRAIGIFLIVIGVFLINGLSK